jgi:hypothetical protein
MRRAVPLRAFEFIDFAQKEDGYASSFSERQPRADCRSLFRDGQSKIESECSSAAVIRSISVISSNRLSASYRMSAQ